MTVSDQNSNLVLITPLGFGLLSASVDYVPKCVEGLLKPLLLKGSILQHAV